MQFKFEGACSRPCSSSLGRRSLVPVTLEQGRSGKRQPAPREGVLELSFTHGLEKWNGNGGGRKVSLPAPAL